MGKFLSKVYRGLEAYTPGEQPKDKKYVKLNTNESPFPPSPLVWKALRECSGDLNLYPDPTYASLRATFAAYHGVEPDCVTVGSGSDELLDWIFRAFFQDRGVVFPDVTYGFYKVWADLYGIEYRTIPLKDDFTVDPDDYIPKENGENPAVVIANPNAPTGVFLPVEQIARIADADPSRPVVVDEAYADFAPASSIPLVREHENVIVVRTLSKSRSLAGARAAYCVASPDVIRDIDLIRFATNPYNVSRMACAAAEASFEDDEYFRANVAAVVSERERLEDELARLGFETTPSSANFVFTRFPGKDGKAIAAALRERGVLVRRFDGERTGDRLRITVGSREQNDVLLRELAAIVT